MSDEDLFDADMSMKNVETPSLWELIKKDALEKKNMQSDMKLNKCDQCTMVPLLTRILL